jgi:uncharacterized protein HemX
VTADECKVLSSPDLLQILNLVATIALGAIGTYFVYKQNKILADQNRIFEKQNEFNNRVIEVQERMDKKQRLINRAHYAGIKDVDLDKLVEDLLTEGIHYSEVAGTFREMGIPTELSTQGLKTRMRIEESFKRGRSKLGVE